MGVVKLIHKDLWSYLLIIAFALWAGRWLLLPGYFNMHDDLQMMRQLAMETCFKDLQIPCRWTQHMGYGFGFPLFNYYPSLPYMVGELFRLVGFTFVNTIKLIFLVSFIASGLTMYIFAREFWGKLGGILSAVFYIWAPYHAVDIYVRGAMNEAWGLIWFPLILWSGYKLVVKARFRYIVVLALAWFGLLTSHNLMVIIFTPLFAAWVIFWLIKSRAWFSTIYLFLSGVWAFGLAAFFSLPVFIEQGFVHVETLTMGYYEYLAHFPNIYQLLMSRFWGYGASVWMATDDRMSFQVGHVHWILSLVIGLILLARFLKRRKLTRNELVLLLVFLAGWFAVFMAHPRSAPIWSALDDFLKYMQFPWRFLTMIILCFSFIAGGVIVIGSKSVLQKSLLAVFLILALVLPNMQYFQPEHLGPLTDEEKFSGAAWNLQQTAGIYDYLPIDAQTAPKSAQKSLVDVLEGNTMISDSWQNSNSAKFKARVVSDKSYLQLNIFKFPNWKVFIDGKEIATEVGKDEWGRMRFNLDKGEHEVRAHLYDTPLRSVGNYISLFSWMALLTVPLWRKKDQRARKSRLQAILNS